MQNNEPMNKGDGLWRSMTCHGESEKPLPNVRVFFLLIYVRLQSTLIFNFFSQFLFVQNRYQFLLGMVVSTITI